MPGGTKTVDKTVYKARLQINTDKKHDYSKDSTEQNKKTVHELCLFMGLNF